MERSQSTRANNYRKDGGIEVSLFKSPQNKVKSETISEEVRKKFGTKVEASFKVIAENPSFSAEEIASILKITSRTVEKHQAKLKKANYIKRKGENIGGYWEIINNE